MRKAGGSPNCWDSMAPTPVVEASTSTLNRTLGSGWRRMGAVLKAVLSFLKASWALVFQDRDLGFSRSIDVSGAVCKLKSLMKRR